MTPLLVDDCFSELFLINVGVKQGGKLSSYLMENSSLWLVIESSFNFETLYLIVGHKFIHYFT